MNKERRKAHRKGFWSEWIAAIFLFFKGYRIVAMRYRTKLGEIDIIARKRDLVAIVEVKARDDVMTAVNAVSNDSKRRISNAADLWLSKQKDYGRLSIRFDIIAVCPRTMPVHLKDAF